MPRLDSTPLQATLKGLIVDRVDFCRAGSNGESDIVLFKRDKRTPIIPTTTRKGVTVPENTEPTPEQIASLQKSIDDAVAAAIAKHDEDVAAFLKGENEPPADDPVAKAVAEAVAVEKAAREALEADVAKMRDEKVTEVMKAKAATVANVGNASDVAEVLKAVATDCKPEIADKLDEILKAAHARIDLTKLTKDKGGIPSAEDDAYATLKAKAEELRQADPSLAPDAAFAKAVRELPEVFATYRKSLSGKAA